MPKERFNNIDLLRFLFAELIVFYHLTPKLQAIFPDNSFFEKMTLQNQTVGVVIVLCFFIISGFFSYLSNDYKKRTLLQFIWRKATRLWPILFVSLVCVYKSPVDLLNLFFISSGTGLLTTGSSNPASWYICVLLFVEIASYMLFSTERENNSSFDGKITPQLLILVVLSFLSFVIIGQRTTSDNYALLAFDSLPMLTNGVLSAIAGYGLGYFIGFLYKTELSKIAISNILKKTIISIIEASIFIAFLCLVSFTETSSKKFPFIFFIAMFVVLLIDFILKPGYVSRLFNTNISRILGSWSYAIYIMQWPCFVWLSDWIWKMDLEDRDIIFFSMLFCTVVGVVSHYVIEVFLVSIVLKKHERVKTYAEKNTNIGQKNKRTRF